MNMRKPITEWAHPAGEKFPSQYGEVTYQAWCEREIRRLHDKGDLEVHLVKDRASGLIAISR